jgi:8-oxo-dGTP diphosphatase
MEPVATTPTYPQPMVAVDVVAFTVLDADLKVLLIRRGLPPHVDGLALPGGFVRCGDGVDERGEDLEDAARRELVEETGLPAVAQMPLVQLAVLGAPDRDPRTRVISVAWLCLVRPELAAFVRAGTDARAVQWTSLSTLDRASLAFDHAEILARGERWLHAEIDNSDVARALVPTSFSVAEFRAVVEAVTGKPRDPGNFRRHFQLLLERGVVEPAEGSRVTGRRRAGVFRFVDAHAQSSH